MISVRTFCDEIIMTKRHGNYYYNAVIAASSSVDEDQTIDDDAGSRSRSCDEINCYIIPKRTAPSPPRGRVYSPAPEPSLWYRGERRSHVFVLYCIDVIYIIMTCVCAVSRHYNRFWRNSRFRRPDILSRVIIIVWRRWRYLTHTHTY